MDYKFSINDFEGPLDLLLHLVKTSKMDIYDIDIRLIIEEYLNFIENEKNRNIDIASSYLVMAAELIHLKSKMLVNDEEIVEDSVEEFSIVSEEDLKKKIIEYEKYKMLTGSLESQMNKRNNFYTKSPSKLDDIVKFENVNYKDVSLDDLILAFKNFKSREKYAKPLATRITKREYNINDRIKDIRKILMVREKLEFLDLFEDNNKDFIIVTFLAILMMSKSAEVKLTQEDNFKPIMIERVSL